MLCKLLERLDKVDDMIVDVSEMMEPMETKCGIHGIRLSVAENAMYDMLLELKAKLYRTKRTLEFDIRLIESMDRVKVSLI